MSGSRASGAGAEGSQGVSPVEWAFRSPPQLQNITLSNAPGGVQSVRFPNAIFQAPDDDQIVSLSLEYKWGDDGAAVKATLCFDGKIHNMNSSQSPAASILFRPMKIRTLNKLISKGQLRLSEGEEVEAGQVAISLFVTPRVGGVFHLSQNRIGGILFSVHTSRSAGVLSPSSKVVTGGGGSAEPSPVKDAGVITHDDRLEDMQSPPTSPGGVDARSMLINTSSLLVDAAPQGAAAGGLSPSSQVASNEGISEQSSPVRDVARRQQNGGAAVREAPLLINIEDRLASSTSQQGIYDIARLIRRLLDSALREDQYDEIVEMVAEILAAPVPVRPNAVATSEHTPLLIDTNTLTSIIPKAKICLAINIYLANEGLQAKVHLNEDIRVSQQDIAAIGARLARPVIDDIDVAVDVKTGECRESAKKGMLSLEAKAQAVQGDLGKADEAACWQEAAKQARQYYDATLHPGFGPTSVRVSALMAFIAIGAAICSAIALSDKGVNDPHGLDIAGVALGAVGLAHVAYTAVMARKAWPEGVKMRGSLALAGIIAVTSAAALIMAAFALSHRDAGTHTAPTGVSATVFSDGFQSVLSVEPTMSI